MKFETSISQELLPTTDAPLDGAMVRQLSPFLKHLEDVIMEASMEWSKSVPIDAPPFQLSITASVTGEPQTNESSTSTTQPGTSSPTNPSAQDLSQSALEVGKAMHQELERYLRPQQEGSEHQETPPSPTPLQRFGFDPSWQHYHHGSPYANCTKCSMPFGARQHRKLGEDGGPDWPITYADVIKAQYELSRLEAKPFA